MSKRAQLQGAARRTVGAFIGRNNDVDGYWAIGMLCRRAVDTGVASVSFDLLQRTSVPAWAIAEAAGARAATRLRRHLDGLSMPESVLRAATVELHFEPSAGEALVPYRCTHGLRRRPAAAPSQSVSAPRAVEARQVDVRVLSRSACTSDRSRAGVSRHGSTGRSSRPSQLNAHRRRCGRGDRGRRCRRGSARGAGGGAGARGRSRRR